MNKPIKTIFLLFISLCALLWSGVSSLYGQTTWTELQPQIQTPKKFRATRFYPHKTDTVFAKAKRLYQSIDAGKNWAVSQGDTNVVGFAETERHELFTASPKALNKSTNQGLDWFSAVKSTPPDLTCLFVRALPNNINQVFLGSASGLYRGTVDTTLEPNWENVLPEKNAQEIVALGDTLFASFIHAIYRSFDNGSNWTQVFSTDQNIRGLVAVKGRGVFAMINNSPGSAIIHSANLGKDWDGFLGVAFSSASFTVLARNDSGDIYFCGGLRDELNSDLTTQGIVYRLLTTSFGWDPYYGGLPQNDITGLGFDARGRAYASTDSLGVFRIADSNLVSVRNQPINNQTISQWYPNPTKSSATIEINADNTQNARLSFFDLVGISIMDSKTVKLFQGLNRLSFDYSSLPGGAYLCRVDMGGASIIRTIILTK